MADRPTIPARPEDVTAEWLTQVLGSSAALPDAVEVTSVEVLDQHSGTTGRMRVGLEYAGASGPASVFVKLPPFDESQQALVAFTDMGRREARFYESVASEVDIRIPTAFYAAHGDEPGEYVMVLEDLEAKGVTFTNRLEPRAETMGLSVVESLARLHAHFWNDARFTDELSWLQPAMRSPYGAQLIASAKDQFAADMPPVFGELCDLFVEHWEPITTIWDQGEQTLVHGDTHAGNQFLDGSTAGLYDWAVISRSPGVRDLAIYLGNSVPTEVRRAHQDDWLAAYHRVLVESGVAAPSPDELLTRLRRTVLYSWVGATTTAAMGSKWQTKEVGLLGMDRATTSCIDLGTLDALREAL